MNDDFFYIPNLMECMIFVALRCVQAYLDKTVIDFRLLTDLFCVCVTSSKGDK